MIEIVKKFTEKDEADMLADLERRFQDPGVAQQVMDEIKKADRLKNAAPLRKEGKANINYMLCKALSELKEAYCEEYKNSRKQLKAVTRKAKYAANDVLRWEDKLLQKECEKFLKYYWLSHNGFWVSYRQAIPAEKTGTIVPQEIKKISLLDEAWQNTVMTVAA